MGGCVQREIPKEGDIVTWMDRPELIIKTKLGQRREHIPNLGCDKCEAKFEPEYERYIGQFPVNYVPERFPKMTQAELDAFLKEYNSKLHAVKSQHPLEFSLMLNGVKGKATDEGFYSPKVLDDVNQVKVLLQGLANGKNFTSKEAYEGFPKSNKHHYDKTFSDTYGLECYSGNDNLGLKCFGRSSNDHVFGYLFTPMDENTMWVRSWEPIYGGIQVEWRIHLKSLKHWKEVDAAIWRLLESWNVSSDTSQVKKSIKAGTIFYHTSPLPSKVD